MKTYKKILAEGLVLAGLLGVFGCTDSRETKLEYRYKLNYDEVLNKSSKVEDYLKKQGFRVETKEYIFSDNTGYMLYKNNGTAFYMVIYENEPKADDDRHIVIHVTSTDGKFDFTNLEKKVYEIMTEETK